MKRNIIESSKVTFIFVVQNHQDFIRI